MKLNQTRFGLLSIFTVCLAIQLAAIIAVRQRMWPEDLEQLALKLLGMYSVHLGVILGCIFAQSHTRSRVVPQGVAWTAILLSVFWNLLLLWRSISFSMAEQDSVTDLVNYYEKIASHSSFLVAGAVAFFFSRSASADKA